jgi:hypothetical protein
MSTSELNRELSQALAESGCGRGPTHAGVPGHDLHIYHTEESLIHTVVHFLAAGVRAGQPIVVIATEEHRRAFADGLRAQGLDTEELYTGRLAVWLDARSTLSAFMEGARPNRELFMATIGNVFEGLIKKRSYLIVRGFGEMVDLLWKDGNAEGALLVEQLWNDLADRYSYSLLCAYSVQNFFMPGGIDGFRRVCAQHTHALSLENAEENVA